MDDFVESLGLEYLAHVLRRISDELVSGETEWRLVIGVRSPPRTSSTLFLLERNGPTALTEIARQLRQSHQLVMTWVRRLRDHDMVRVERDPRDARKSLIALTESGHAEIALLRKVTTAEVAALRRLLDDADADVFDALWRMEKACRKKRFADRLLEETERETERGCNAQLPQLRRKFPESPLLQPQLKP